METNNRRNAAAYFCPICGKEFYPTREWVYRDHDNFYCSWTCYRRVHKNKTIKLKGEENKENN